MTFDDALARARRAYQRGRDGGEHHPTREPRTRTPHEEASEALGLYHRLRFARHEPPRPDPPTLDAPPE